MLNYKEIAKQLMSKKGCIEVYKKAVEEDNISLAVSAMNIYTDMHWDKKNENLDDILPNWKDMYERVVKEIYKNRETLSKMEEEFFGVCGMLVQVAKRVGIENTEIVKKLREYLFNLNKEYTKELEDLIERGDYYNALKKIDIPKAYANLFGNREDKKRIEKMENEIVRLIEKG